MSKEEQLSKIILAFVIMLVLTLIVFGFISGEDFISFVNYIQGWIYTSVMHVMGGPHLPIEV